MASSVSGKGRRRRTKVLQVDITRFVTGAEKTERCHIEAAFVVCLEVAKLAITEFRESKLGYRTGPTNMAGGCQRQQKMESMTAECGRWPRVDGTVHGPGHKDPSGSIRLETGLCAVYHLLSLLGLYRLKQWIKRS